MHPTRRKVLTMTGAVAVVFAARPLNARAIPQQSHGVTPQPMASPNAPPNENVPAGLDGANIPVVNGQHAIPPATWMEIKSDAQQLYEMAADFKRQVDSTNLVATLPLPLLQEAHRIEKLAKHIQSRMKS
jgi:hypothetical protein